MPALYDMVDLDFRGVVAVWQGEKLVLRRAAGYSDFPNSLPNDAMCRFATASAGKAFVAAGILRLVEKGRLSLADTLGRLVPIDWKAIDTGITVRELLCHTSGIPDYFDESTMSDYEALWRRVPCYAMRANSDLLPLFIDKPMMYRRGERFQYNNTGYVVLGMIIERVTGMPFDEYLRDDVFSVCGMRHTGYYELDRLPEHCAVNYIYDAQRSEYRTNIYSVEAKGTGAGGAFTTVYDVRKFWLALLSGRLLSEQTVGEMTSCQASDGKSQYGYGLWLRQRDDVLMPSFEGSDPGVSFYTEYNPKKRIISVLVSNYGDDVWRQIDKIRACLY